jgi:hypothetical protein
MSARTAYPLKMSASLKKAAARLASEGGVSLNHWINMAVAQKIGAVETAEHFRRRYGEARHGNLRAVLDKRPDVPPDPGDELPEELAARSGRA